MKKFVSLTLWIISIYIAIVLFLSLALTQNSFYSFLAKTYTETNPSFELVQVNWHPFNPSVILQDLKLESKEQNISLGQASVEFSLENLILEQKPLVSLNSVQMMFLLTVVQLKLQTRIFQHLCCLILQVLRPLLKILK